MRPQTNIRTKAPSRSSCRLVVEKIPAESCTITAVHDHFARFGTIVNIDLLPEQSRARIQYSDHEAATAAFSSPDVIFGNRFVRVYWEADETASGADVAEQTTSLETQEQPQYHQMQHKNYPLPYQQMQQTPLTPQEELLRKRKETLDAFLELQKQKESLLHKYILQQKTILEALANPSIDEKGRATRLEELKIVEEAISSIKPENKSEKTTPVLRGGPASRGRGGYTLYPSSHQEVLPKPPAAYKLDLRPRTLKMQPIPPTLGSDPGSIRKFFEPYGQLENLVVAPDASHAIVTFLRRPDAEKVLILIYHGIL